LQPLAKNARRRAEKGVSGRASKEGRRAVGPSEGEGLRKTAMRSESGVPRSSGLHLVAACDAHNQQLVSRRRILKYSMYTMIQALELRATAGRAAGAGHRPENARCFRFRGGSAPRAHWRRGTTTHPPHNAPGPAERASTVQPNSYRRVVECIRGAKACTRGDPNPPAIKWVSRSVAQAERGGRPDKTVQARTHRADSTNIPQGIQ
jgi:hypothetical protein